MSVYNCHKASIFDEIRNNVHEYEVNRNCRRIKYCNGGYHAEVDIQVNSDNHIIAVGMGILRVEYRED